MHLVESDARGVSLKHLETVVLEEVRVEVPVQELVLALHEGDVGGGDDGGVLRARALAAPREGVGRVVGGGGGPDAQTAQVGHGVVEGEVHGEGVGGAGGRHAARHLVPVEHAIDGGDGGGDGDAVGDGVARGAGDGGRERRHEGVEVHGRRLVLEVELDRQHALGALDLAARSDDGAVGGGGVAASGGRGGRDDVAHVVGEDLNAVEVGDDTALVVEAGFVRSHGGDSGEGLAEVLGAGNGSHLGSERDGVPGAVVVGVLRPGARRRRSHFPTRILQDGIVKRQGKLFSRETQHHVLEEYVTVDAANLEIGTSKPGITIAVLHDHSILIVGVLGNAVLEGLQRLAGQGNTLSDSSGAAFNLIGFFFSVSSALLDRFHIVFGVGTLQGKSDSR